MKRFLISLILVSVLFLSTSGKEFNCFTILVGSEASADGSVFLAHNEDDSYDNFVNIYKLPGKNLHTGNPSIQLKNGAIFNSENKQIPSLWLQLPNQEFADAYLNEEGVVIVSNQCKSREDRPQLTSGGIGFKLRRIIGRQAHTARQAVLLAGQLIDRYGYYSSGRSYCIADPKEAWIVHVVKGKHWIAQKIPSNKVAVIANFYTISNIDLSDKDNYLGSLDIIDYAKKRGWYNPQKEGEFDFARAYSDPSTLKHEENILRQWRATNLLSKKKFNIDQRLPFHFSPHKKIKIIDLFKILRDHYEGTKYDLTNNYKKGSPNSTANRTICDVTTQYSLVAQLREDLPKEIANLAWIAFRRPDSNAFTPWYFSIYAPPPGYYSEKALEALNTHFKKAASYFSHNESFSFFCFQELSNLTDKNYRNRIKYVRKEWQNLENFLLKKQEKKEKEFFYLYKKNRGLARKLITNYVHEMEFRKWFLSCELIERIKKENEGSSK